MWLIFIALSVGACLATSGTALFVVAIVNAVLAVLANGVLANFSRDPQAAPNWAATVSIVTIVSSLGLVIAGLVIR